MLCPFTAGSGLIGSRYCVRPNSGRIEPGKEVEVTGTLYEQNMMVRS